MRHRYRMGVFFLASMVALASAPGLEAKEQGGREHGGGEQAGKGSPHSEKPPGFEKGKKKGWKGESHPPGWSKGKKKGWQGKSQPPGQGQEGGTP